MTLDELLVIRFCLKITQIVELTNFELSKVKQGLVTIEREIRLKELERIIPFETEQDKQAKEKK